eukprot:scaffold925_cov129-Cylindrotheca_fusiformis.AAC.25
MRTITNTAIRALISLTAVSSDAAFVESSSCRSNGTHIAWYQPSMATMPAFGSRRSQTIVSSSTCVFQLREDAEQECLGYLRDNIMAFDLAFLETMGFGDEDDEADGLENGMVGPTVTLALDAKVLYPWADELPKYIFLNYVLNYGNLNEARTNWRPLLVDVMNFTDTSLWRNGKANLTSAVTWTNKNLWTLLGREGAPIYFKSSQTPLIFDPMSIIAFGYASCTGTSILFSNALRALGIPSRVAGTPAWYGNNTQGNHNWVEVYDRGTWKFLEPSPALANVDTLDADPCSRWFCKQSRYPSSKVYAARMSRMDSSAESFGDKATYFPLAWERDCQDVPGIDRTQYYTETCGMCV